MGELVSVSQQDLEFFSPFLAIYRREPWIERKTWSLKVRRKETYEHTLRVAFIATKVASYLNLNPEQAFTLDASALVHDVGKLHIPDELLIKRELTEADRLEIEKHVREGFERVKKHSPLLARIIVGHHEFQPNPYPRKGGRVTTNPEEVRLQHLLSLCDTTDALLSARSYKEPWPREKVQDDLTRQFGDWGLVHFAIKTRLEIAE